MATGHPLVFHSAFPSFYISALVWLLVVFIIINIIIIAPVVSTWLKRAGP